MRSLSLNVVPWRLHVGVAVGPDHGRLERRLVSPPVRFNLSRVIRFALSSALTHSAARWYAHYDGSPSFGDFSPFGGWSSPAIKQYQGDASICGAGVDLNWYPDFAGGLPPWYNASGWLNATRV